MSIIFEAWEDEESVTFATADSIADQKLRGLISSDAVLLHTVEADTFEDAMTIHHVKMGYEPYKPMS